MTTVDVQDALAIIHRVEYRAGWEIEARKTYDHCGSVTVEISFEPPNSDVQYAPQYEAIAMQTAKFRLYVEDCRHAWQVQDMLLDCILRMEIHETREFFGVRDAMGVLDKPYHPHTVNGIKRWRERSLARPYNDDDLTIDLLGPGGTF